MADIYDIKKRADELSAKWKTESIPPEEVGDLIRDLADYANQTEINGSSLGIRKTYATVSAMEADSNPVDDKDGTPLRRGMLVNIYNQDDASAPDNGKVFSWQNPGWQLRTKLDAGYATTEQVDAIKTEQDEKISELASLQDKKTNNILLNYQGEYNTEFIPKINTSYYFPITIIEGVDYDFHVQLSEACKAEIYCYVVEKESDEELFYLGTIGVGETELIKKQTPKVTSECRVKLAFYSVPNKVFFNIKSSYPIEKRVFKNINDLKMQTDIFSVANEKIIFFGDSITALRDSNDKRYSDYIHDITGATVYNAGIPGARLSKRIESVKITFKKSAESDGSINIKIKGFSDLTFDVTTSDTKNDIAVKYGAKLDGFSIKNKISDDSITIFNWDDYVSPIELDNIEIVTSTGVTIEKTKNSNGMIDTFYNVYHAYTNLDVSNMVLGLINGDWTLQESAANYINDNAVKGAVAEVKDVLISEINTVVIFAGTNDYNLPNWGEDNSTDNTLSGNINWIVSNLLAANPKLKILFITPIVRYFGSSIASWDDAEWGDNKVVGKNNGVMIKLVDRIKSVVRHNHIPIADLYWNIGWNKYNYSQYFNDGDGTHPKKGVLYLAQKIIPSLMQGL